MLNNSPAEINRSNIWLSLSSLELNGISGGRYSWYGVHQQLSRDSIPVASAFLILIKFECLFEWFDIWLSFALTVDGIGIILWLSISLPSRHSLGITHSIYLSLNRGSRRTSLSVDCISESTAVHFEFAKTTTTMERIGEKLCSAHVGLPL